MIGVSRFSELIVLVVSQDPLQGRREGIREEDEDVRGLIAQFSRPFLLMSGTQASPPVMTTTSRQFRIELISDCFCSVSRSTFGDSFSKTQLFCYGTFDDFGLGVDPAQNAATARKVQKTI